MKLSELAKDSWATSILALIPFGALFWVREEYGRAAFTDLFAAIAAYAALWFVIFTMRGEGKGPEDRALEGTVPRRKWDVWVTCEGCKDRYRFHPDRYEILDCIKCGTRIVWGGQYEQPVQVQVQSEEGDGE